MAGDAKKLQPIIIKRVRKGGHAAHGGAWKIAYADFVTAMMAFFLMMWLLGSTTEGDRKGISDYFNMPLRVSLFGGSYSGDASHVIKGGGQDISRTSGQVKQGDIESEKRTVNLQALRAEQKKAEQSRLEQLQEDLKAKIESMPQFDQFKSQLKLDMTRDGLRIQLVDADKRPMFASGSAVVQPYMRDLLREIGQLLLQVPNRLTIEGHTDSTPFGSVVNGYSNWELSADRANASRRELMSAGIPDERILRVQGMAASTPFEPENTTAAVNRRISIVVMNRDAVDRFFRGGDDPPPRAPARGGDSPAAAPAAVRPQDAPAQRAGDGGGVQGSAQGSAGPTMGKVQLPALPGLPARETPRGKP